MPRPSIVILSSTVLTQGWGAGHSSHQAGSLIFIGVHDCTWLSVLCICECVCEANWGRWRQTADSCSLLVISKIMSSAAKMQIGLLRRREGLSCLVMNWNAERLKMGSVWPPLKYYSMSVIATCPANRAEVFHKHSCPWITCALLLLEAHLCCSCDMAGAMLVAC